MANSPGKKQVDLLNGPGKLCRSFGLSREQNGLSLTGKELYVEDRHEAEVAVVRSTRIGIREGKELTWRFYDKTSPAVSTYKR